MLANSPVIATLPCTDLDRARRFYGGTLGLPEVRLPMPADQDGRPIGAAFHGGEGTMIFVYLREEPPASNHTAASWLVKDFDTVIDDLIKRGITFDTYPDMPDVAWDARGVATSAYSDDRSAWFSDPDGNILAINNMPGE
jgi:catechol 2,3-dioxygenase-like lactoylglutathione lyase family enzyme